MLGGKPYLPPPVRASQSGPPSYFETMAYTVCDMGGIPLRVHAIFPVMLAINTFIGLAYFGFKFAFLLFLVNGPILFCSVLIHELSHCAVARYYGAEITHISLWIFGGLTYVGHRANPSEDNWIALAGPLSHIPQGLFWMILGAESVPVSALTTGPTGQTTVNSSDYAAVYNDFWLQLCSLSLLLQFILFFTNLLLPVYPLDGGRLLVNTLSHLGVGLESAAYIVSAAGLGVGGLIFGLGLLGSATQAAFGLWVLYSAFLLRQKAGRGEADFDPLFAHYTGGPPGPAQGGGGGYAGAGGAPVFHPAAPGPGYGAGGLEAGVVSQAPSAHYGSL